MTAPRVLLERDETIVRLTLNRPDKLNAIDGAMLDALDQVLGQLEADRECRAVILTGAGRAFSAGADIKRMSEPGRLGRSALVGRQRTLHGAEVVEALGASVALTAVAA